MKKSTSQVGVSIVEAIASRSALELIFGSLTPAMKTTGLGSFAGLSRIRRRSETASAFVTANEGFGARFGTMQPPNASVAAATRVEKRARVGPMASG
ncbi:MAG: hypothetical protein ACO3QC_01125, partial [Phycisphaerales bacterium]